MGRHFKEGLDYFELECQLNDKVKLIQAEFGLKGFAVIVKLFQKIYGQHGYYCEWNEDTLLLFMSENGLDSESNKGLVGDIVKACIRRNIFSENMYTRYHILTSAGIQTRYLNAVSRRDHVKLRKEFLLIDVDQNFISADIYPINVDINEENVSRNPQSREEKSREEESRGEKSKTKRADKPPGLDYSAMIAERDFSFAVSEVLEEFVLYKKNEKKFSYQKIGFKNLLDNVQENVRLHGDEAVIRLIRNTMANGWQGIFWNRISENAGNSRYDSLSTRISEVDKW